MKKSLGTQGENCDDKTSCLSKVHLRNPFGGNAKVKRAQGGERNGRKVLLGALVVFGIHSDDASALKLAIRFTVNVSIPKPSAAKAEGSKVVILIEILSKWMEALMHSFNIDNEKYKKRNETKSQLSGRLFYHRNRIRAPE